jgi:hypothetical protein
MKPIGFGGWSLNTHRPHPEEAHRSRVYPRSAHQVRKSATADLRCAVSKDGRWLGLVVVASRLAADLQRPFPIFAADAEARFQHGREHEYCYRPVGECARKAHFGKELSKR